MRNRLSIVLAICLCLSSLPCLSQTTKVRGKVLDASDGKPLPFAAVFFAGTQTGTTTGIDGEFDISVRDLSCTDLRIQMVGYGSVTVTVRPGVFNELNVSLVPDNEMLNTVTVKADNSKARRLLANIDANRDRNNPEKLPHYSCDVYSKLELDLTHPEEQLRSKAVRKQWNFIFDYMDTSEISGVPYLPIIINESVAKRHHSLVPEVNFEEILATRLSGGNQSTGLISQFTGSMHLKNDFYTPFINAFNVEIPSPINSSGLLFYNYFIIDSLLIDGRKTLLVRYHPKDGISTPAFDGEMLIDAGEYALREIKARLKRGQNMNWVRDMVIEKKYERLSDSVWFHRTERFYADFSVSLADSSKMLSLIGNRTLEFTNPTFNEEELSSSLGVVKVADDAGDYDEEYWAGARPYELSAKEKGIYSMVERVQGTKLYETWYDVVYTAINGYWDIGKIGLGPYLKLISYNPLEGFRMRLGIHTSVDWSKKDRFSGYLAFGCRDKVPKGGLSWEHLFSKSPTRKLTVDAHYDALQLGCGIGKYNKENILASILGAGRTQKLCYVAEGSALYDHEVNAGINLAGKMMYRHFFATSFVPLRTVSGKSYPRISSGEANVSLRFSRDETVTRGHFIKTYTHTKHPVFTLSLAGGAAAMMPFTGSVFAYFRPELTMNWKVSVPPVGFSSIRFNAGTIVGKVPYPFLHLHEGNGTLLLDKSSFSTMDFFEFASDTWVTLMIDHNFHGFFLGKIPGIADLNFREAFTFKATWGYLSHKNDGTVYGRTAKEAALSEAPLLFPDNMHSVGKVPFIEMGFGITNIFRLFRVDFIWRVTHRDDPRPKPRNFVVNIGLEFKF